MPSHVPIALKLALLIILLVVSGMGALGLFILGNQNRVMQEQLDEFGETIARHLAHLAAEPVLSEDSLRLRLLTANLVEDQRVLGAAIFAHNGRLLSSAGLLPKQSPGSDNGTEPLQRRLWPNPGDSSERLISFTATAVYKNVQVGYTVVTLSASLMDVANDKARRAIIYATVFMCLLASLLAYFMSRRLSLPIQNLMEATRAIDRGDLDVRISDRRNDEIGFLIDGFNSMAEGLLRKSQVEQIFSRYVSKNVASKVLANLDEVRLGSQHVEATVLFADIVGFTAMAERLQPAEVSSLLNEYFSYISTACRLYGGVVDKFIGDCVMLVFGAVENDADHSFNAVCCALLIQKMIKKLNQQRRKDGHPEVHFRIGINSGSMLAGNLGSDERMEYTVVGDAVNLASRLCYAAQPGQIILREDLYKQLHNSEGIYATAQGCLPIRGKSQPVTVYDVTGLPEKYHPRLNAYLEEVLTSRDAIHA
ncbi:MAG: HAMP domain-containing protein [Gammaproteobacteria bacterium]|nr:HAMP domain-containing protein [Gammaproteobacteria bacterium]